MIHSNSHHVSPCLKSSNDYSPSFHPPQVPGVGGWGGVSDPRDTPGECHAWREYDPVSVVESSVGTTAQSGRSLLCVYIVYIYIYIQMEIV